jgi:MoaA/NifB/PqqE/SkfB family radical SAM enzyme
MQIKLERISLDVSNQCSKACTFCYNQSTAAGHTVWQPSEIINLAANCAENGVKAFSLGGGEPLEYKGIFEVISALKPHVFVSVTSNGLPLLNQSIFGELLKNPPHKIHLSIHSATNISDVIQTIGIAQKLKSSGIKTGINLLVSSNELAQAKALTKKLYQNGFTAKEIIFIPRKYSFSPTANEVANVAGKKYFQSAACLYACAVSLRYCSISWDKKVNYCSYSPGKSALKSLDYIGIINALKNINFKTCV